MQILKKEQDVFGDQEKVLKEQDLRIEQIKLRKLLKTITDHSQHILKKCILKEEKEVDKKLLVKKRVEDLKNKMNKI